MEYWRDDNDDNDDDESELQDYTFSGKDAILFLIDATPAMHKKSSDEEDNSSPFEMSLRCVQSTLKNKIFGSPNDVMAVAFFGTEKKIGVNDFDNLSVLFPFSIAEGKNILLLDEHLTEHPARFETDFGYSETFKLHEALWLGQTMFNDINGKCASKKILLFTCNDDPHAANEVLKKQATKKGTDLAETGITLEVLPVGNPNFDPNKFYVDLLPDSVDESFIEASMQKFQDLLDVVRKRVHKKRALGRIKFSLGGNVDVAVSVYNFVQRAYKPSKKKLTKDTNEEVRIHRQFIHPTTAATLLPSDINKFQEFAGQKIRFTIDETKTLMAMDGTCGLKLLAFKDRHELRWHHFVRQPHFIYPDEVAVKGSRPLFTALLLRCIARNVVAICSFKLRAGSQPYFVALVPYIEKNVSCDDDVTMGDDHPEEPGGTPKGFLVVYLPFSDDIRGVPEVPLEPTDENEVELAKKIIRKLRLKHYDPEAFENPDLQAHYRLIEGHALQLEEDLESVPDLTLPPVERMDKKLGPLIQEFNSTFALPDAQSSGPAKRAKQDSKPTMTLSSLPFDILDHVRQKTVEKLKVDELKQVVKTFGVAVTGLKKAELVAIVYDKVKG